MNPIKRLADHIQRYYRGRPKKPRRQPAKPHVITQAECHQGADALPEMRCPYLKADGSCETFTCARCKRDYPWCQGAADDQPDWCDDCRVHAP